jgi:nucleotide-binding universal stress UspA family protein
MSFIGTSRQARGILLQSAKPAEVRTRRLVARTREAFLSQEVAVDVEVLQDRPDAAIAGYAEKVKADLIAMASRGSTGTERYVLGSTSEDVVQSAPCSLLVVKGP